MSRPRIAHVDPQGADALALLLEASLDTRALYPELFTPDSPPATNGPLGERSVYVVAYEGDEPLACGAFRPVDQTTAELRRMYVHRNHRRQGLARAVLAHLIGEARRLGYERLVLETGYKQEAAMALYEAAGFVRIEPFGDYAGAPTSVCFGLTLPEAPAFVGPLRYPWMRTELVGWLQGLANADYQRRVWVQQEPWPGVAHDEFHAAVNFFYDETRLAQDPELYLGLVLGDLHEVAAIRGVTAALDALFAAEGLARADAEYIAAPGWPGVLAAAQKALALLRA